MVDLLFIRSQLIASLIMSYFVCVFFHFSRTNRIPGKSRLSNSNDYFKIDIHKCIYDGFTHFHGIVQSHIPNSQHYLFCINNCLYGIRNCIIKYNEGIVYWINQVNPIAIYSTILQSDQELSLMTIFFYSIMLIISIISALTFKTEPVWSSQ